MSKVLQEPMLDATIRFDNLPATGRDLQVDATAEQRARLAERLKISAIEELRARLHATPFRGGIRVTGELKASTVQPCVVTFVPVTQRIDEAVDRILLPHSERPRSSPAGAEVFVDLESDEEPDYFEGPEVDLGNLLIETLALALDPYPRAPGASLDGVLPQLESPPDSPFAALKRLKGAGSET